MTKPHRIPCALPPLATPVRPRIQIIATCSQRKQRLTQLLNLSLNLDGALLRFGLSWGASCPWRAAWSRYAGRAPDDTVTFQERWRPRSEHRNLPLPLAPTGCAARPCVVAPPACGGGQRGPCSRWRATCATPRQTRPERTSSRLLVGCVNALHACQQGVFPWLALL